MADNRKAAITAKVAAQCSEFYSKSLSFLEGSTAASAFGSSQSKVDPLESSWHHTYKLTYHLLSIFAVEMEEAHRTQVELYEVRDVLLSDAASRGAVQVWGAGRVRTGSQGKAGNLSQDITGNRPLLPL